MMPTACSDHANLVDEPALLFGALGETPCWLDRKLGHRRRRIAEALVFVRGGHGADFRKNSASVDLAGLALRRGRR